VETLLIEHIRKLAKINTGEKKLREFELLKANLEELFQDPNERLMLKYFDFISWVDSHIKGITYQNAVQAQSERAA